MKIRNKLLNYYNNFSVNNNIWLSIIFGNFLICLIIWNRFIRIRLPRDLVSMEWGSFIIIIGLLFLLNIGMFIYYILKLYKIIPKENSKITYLITNIDTNIRRFNILDRLLNDIKLIIEQHVIYGPHRMYDKIYQRNTKIASCLNKIIDLMGAKLNRYLWVLPKSNWALIVFYLISFTIPQIIPPIIFMIEVVIYHHLDYFYKVLILLLVPLMANIFLFIFKHSLETRMRSIRKFYTFDLFIEGKLILKAHVIAESIIENGSEEHDALLLLYKTKEELTNKWVHYQTLYNVVSQIEIHQNYYKYYLNITRYGLYAVSFCIYFMILCGAYSITILYLNDIACLINNSLQFTFFNVGTLIILLLYNIIIISNKLQGYYNYMYKYIYVKSLCKYVSKMLDNLLTIYKKHILLLYTLLFGIPYTLSYFLFVLELLYINKLYYVFISVYAWLIPQIIYLLLYMIKHDATASLDYYAKFFNITLDEKTDVIHITQKYLEDSEDIDKAKTFINVDSVAQWWEYYYDTKDNVRLINIQITLYNKRLFYFISFLSLLMFAISILYYYTQYNETT